MKKTVTALMMIVAIMSFVLSGFLIWQSLKLIELGAIYESYVLGGVCGVVVAIFFILSGVVAIVLRDSNSEYVPLISFAIILCGCMVRVVVRSNFPDLDYWILIMFLYSFIYFFIGAYMRIKNRN
jgi:hypothetical protein